MKRLLTAACVAALAAAAIQPAGAAEYESGESLSSLCHKPQESALYGFCAGYIIGVADVLEEGSFCPPEGHDKLQIVDASVAWLSRHPENLKAPGRSVIAQSLSESFPCGERSEHQE